MSQIMESLTAEAVAARESGNMSLYNFYMGEISKFRSVSVAIKDNNAKTLKLGKKNKKR